jgi:plasmid replication initiation protein
MYIKSHIAREIIGGIVDSDNAKTYLANIEENFKSSSKTYASTIISKMITSTYNGKGSVRKHILEMTHMAHQLKSMDMDVNEGFLVHFIMSSLGPDFGPFKINYNTQKENGLYIANFILGGIGRAS